MSFVLDTNVLVYAANANCDEHRVCRKLVEEARADILPFSLTWSIAYEFLRVVTHPKVLSTPLSTSDAWRFLKVLQQGRGFGFLLPTERHSAVVNRTLEELPDLRGSLMHDAQIAILMREHGIRRIYTRDTDFHRFPFLEPIDPLRSERS